MPTFDMWGPAQNGFAIQRAQAQDEELRAADIHYKQMQIEAGVQKQALAQQQAVKLQEVLARNQTRSAIDLSQDMIKSGLVEQGGKLLKIASQDEYHQAQIQNTESEVKTRDFNQSLKQAQTFASVIDNVNSQEDYDRAIQQYEPMLGTKLPDAIRNAKWSPEYKEKLQSLGTTFIQKATQNRELYRQQSLDQSRESEQVLRNARVVETQARTKEIEARTANLGKQGKQANVARVPKEDKAQADTLLREEFPDASPDNSALANASYTIASRAQEMIRNNRGMDRATAIQRAYTEAKQAGELTSVEKGGFFGLGSHEEPSFKSKSNAITPKDSTAPQDSVTSVRESFLQAHPGTNLDKAEAYLKAHPNQKAKFKETFGYLPEGL